MVKKKTACKQCTGCGKCGKKVVKKTANRNIKAWYTQDPDIVNPFDDWDTAGTQLWKDDRAYYYNRFKGRKGETLADFCNSRFDLDRFEEMDFRNEEDICEYLKHFGCLAVPLYGGRYGGFDGLVVIGQSGIKKEWGDPKSAKNRKLAKEVLQGEAEAYYQAATGDVYGYVITDDGDDNIQDPFDIQYKADYGEILDEGEDVDSCWGFYGDDSVKEAAKEAWDYAVEKKQERIAKEAKMAPKDRRYTIVKKNVHAPKNARTQIGKMKVGDSVTLRDGTVLTRTANRKIAKKASVKKASPRRR